MFKVHTCALRVHCTEAHSTDRKMFDDDDNGYTAGCEKQCKFFWKWKCKPNSSWKPILNQSQLLKHIYSWMTIHMSHFGQAPPNAWFRASTTPTMANLHYLKLHLTFPILLLLLKNLPVAFPRTLPTFLCVQNSKSNSYSGPNWKFKMLEISRKL